MTVYLKFSIPSHPRYLSVIRAAMGELGAICAFPPKESNALVLAIDEALANTIRHAYGGHTDRIIDVDCRVLTDRVEVTIFDQGDAPDPARLVGKLPDSEALGGRGMHIIRTVMDEVGYEQVPGGNQVRLSKKLPVASSGTGGEGKGL